jgi:hypothetical protein
MYDTPSNWKISILRWTAWLILCLGLAFEIFIIRDAGLVVVNRVMAGQIIQRQNAGQSADIGWIGKIIDFGMLTMSCTVAIIAVVLTVGLDYYLRAGEKNGRLFRRICLITGIEIGVYALAILIQIYL